jgi:uncharacterized membrane protein YhaH (DUF805 family)
MAGVLKYLSFRGRANRQRYWLTVLAIVGLLLASVVLSIVLRIVPLLSIVVIPIWLALVVAVFANATRRLHDRNKSGWWLLLFYAVPSILGIPMELTQDSAGEDVQAFAALIAVVGLPFSIWGLVEMGFLKGTSGPNKFGEDPLGPPLEPAIA